MSGTVIMLFQVNSSDLTYLHHHASQELAGPCNFNSGTRQFNEKRQEQCDMNKVYIVSQIETTITTSATAPLRVCIGWKPHLKIHRRRGLSSSGTSSKDEETTPVSAVRPQLLHSWGLGIWCTTFDGTKSYTTWCVWPLALKMGAIFISITAGFLPSAGYTLTDLLKVTVGGGERCPNACTMYSFYI